MKKRLMALLAAFCMTVSMIGSGTVVSAAEQKTKDEVIVTMPATSEPERDLILHMAGEPESMFMSL